MTKEEFEQAKLDIINNHGQPEYDLVDPTISLNESAKALKALRAKRMSDIHTGRRKLKLTEPEAKAIEESAKYSTAVPVHLNEDDLIVFKPEERDLLITYFENTDLTPKDLSRLHPKFSVSRVVALLHSGHFKRLAGKMFDQTLPVKLQWALLKLTEAKNPKIVERLAEHFGLLKSQETTINLNKPIEDIELNKKLKELGDSNAV